MADVLLRVKVTADGQGNLNAVATGLEKVDAAAKKTEKSAAGLNKELKSFALDMVSIGAAISALTTMANKMEEAADWAEKLGKASRTTGLESRELQQLTRTAENLGYSMETVTSAAIKMNRSVAEGSDAFKTLGLSQQALSRATTEERLVAVAKAMTRVNNDAERAALMMDVFGKSGGELLPLLDQIADGSYRMNVALGDETVKSLEKVDAKIDEFKANLKDLERITMSGLASIAEFAAQTFDILSGEWANRKAQEIRGTGLMVAPHSMVLRPGWAVSANDYLDTSPLSLGIETPEQRKAVADYKAASKKAGRETGNEFAKEFERGVAENLKAMKSFNWWMDNIGPDFTQVLNTRKFEEVLAPAGNKKVFDIGDWSKFDNELTKTNDKTEEVVGNTIKWNDELQAVATQFAFLASFDGPVGKLAGMIGGIASGAAGIGSGLQLWQQGSKAGGFEGFLGKLAGGAGIVGSVLSIGSSIVGGIKSLFGGKSEAEKRAEAEAERQRRLAAQEAARQRAEAGLASSITGIGGIVDNMAVFTDPAVVEAIAGSFSSTFWEVFRKEGITGVEKLRPMWDKMHKQIIDMGLDPVAMGLGRIGQLMDVTGDPRTRALLGVSAGASQLLRGSMDAGFIDTRLVSDQTTLARATLQELQSQGLDASAMADQLTALAQAYRATGQELPDDLKKAMEDAGIKTLETQTELLREIRDILRGGKDVDGTPTNGADNLPPLDPKDTFASGGFINAGSGRLAMLHGREYIVREDQYERERARAGGGGVILTPRGPVAAPGTTSSGGGMEADSFTASAGSSGRRGSAIAAGASQIVIAPTLNASAYSDAQSRAELSQFIVGELINQIRNNPTLRRELRDVR